MDEGNWNGWTAAHTNDVGGDIYFTHTGEIAALIPGFWQHDNFVLRFRGAVHVPSDGDYKFKTESDDGSKLYIDGSQVVDNDGLHGMEVQEGTVTLTAGWHSIVIVMFEQESGEGLVVSWTPTPGAAFETMSSTIPAQHQATSSLEVDVYTASDSWWSGLTDGKSDNDPVLVNVGNPNGDPYNSDLIVVDAGGPFAGDTSFTDLTAFRSNLGDNVPDDKFILRVRGVIVAATAGDYRFKTSSDDGSMLYVDGATVVNNDGIQGVTEVEGTKFLTAGFHEIIITYIEHGGGEAFTAEWAGPGGSFDPIHSDPFGCTDGSAANFNSLALSDDGTCEYPGCIDANADNYDTNANVDDGSCEYHGCMDAVADNYDSGATVDDGSCEYHGCMDAAASNYDSSATVEDGSC